MPDSSAYNNDLAMFCDMFFWKNGDVLAHSLCWKFPLNLKLFDHNFAS
ncbi:hypothetical protein B932_0578 [Gluconobacter oxydans H24]|nr:hypothetical protein B932_0578 [Gluconobacter oxydans H24]